MAVFTSREALQAFERPQRGTRAPTGTEGKMLILRGGADVRCRDYSRASHDPKATQTSVDTQRRRNGETRDKYGWTSIGRYRDNNSPASKRARKAGSRPDYERMLEDIRRDPGDVLILFEMARSARDMSVYITIRDLCIEQGPYYWYVGNTLYDVRDRNDKQQLNDMASRAEGGSDAIAEAVRAGLESQAIDGRPHGSTPFGYRRTKNQVTGKFEKQVPDERKQDGGWTPAGIVRGIYADYLDGVRVEIIAARLNERGIPCPRLWAAKEAGDKKRQARWESGNGWTEGGIYNLLRNISYVAVRMYEGAKMAECLWEPLISDDVYFPAMEKMEKASFKGIRASRAQTLLTCLPTCARCGLDVRHQKARGRATYDTYRCRKGCASVPAMEADAYVGRHVTAYLMESNAIRELEGRAENSAEFAEAQAKIAAWKAELARWATRANSDDWPEVTDQHLEDAHARLMPKIREAQTIKPTGVPAAVRRLVGPGARKRWEGMSLADQRDCLRWLVKITVHPAGKGRWNVKPLEERIEIKKAW